MISHSLIHFRFLLALTALTSLVMLTACAGLGTKPSAPSLSPSAPDQLRLEKVSFSDLPQWPGRELAHPGAQSLDALRAFEKSCEKIAQKPGPQDFGPLPEMGKNQDWQKICAEISPALTTDSTRAQKFFEDHFTPYLMHNHSKAEGLFTGYYEPTLYGSLTRSARYKIPLRSRPKDLVMVNLGEFRENLKGQRIAGRVVGGQLKPYEDRAAIEDGKLPDDMDHALVWVDDAAAAFFLQIQGSGIIMLDSGHTMRVGYDGQNGHIYTAIGKELVQRNLLKKENVSMQTILGWLEKNPQEGTQLMRTNRSYVFFKKLDTAGPVGAQGVVLTPRHSLAVDPVFVPYGAPIYLDVAAADPQSGTGPIRDLVIAQDTGGAITGPVRGDLFWGYGIDAAHNAGLMKSKGSAYILLPK